MKLQKSETERKFENPEGKIWFLKTWSVVKMTDKIWNNVNYWLFDQENNDNLLNLRGAIDA